MPAGRSAKFPPFQIENRCDQNQHEMIQACIRKKSFATGPAIGLARFSLGLLALLAGAACPARGANDIAQVEQVRFAFSARMFTDVNENDAKASVKAWALALGRERHVPVSAEPIILSGTTELKQALRTATIDGAAVTTEEYLSLEPELQSTNLFMSATAGQFTEKYLLLVRSDSGLTNLPALHGRKVVMFDNVRASLAPVWLDVMVSAAGLGTAAEHFNQINMAQKLSQVVLPVFFRQQDACVVTRGGFEMMCEMNPQVRSQLRVLATSPALVPSVGFLRRGFDSPLRSQMLAALEGLEKSTSGTQVLTLFQVEQFHEAPATLLDTARDLIQAHRQLQRAGSNETSRAEEPRLQPDHRDPHFSKQ